MLDESTTAFSIPMEATYFELGIDEWKAAHPEPDESIGRFDGQGSVVGADPRRPEPADFLEVKRGMPRILL
jgi:hypothetical protein